MYIHGAQTELLFGNFGLYLVNNLNKLISYVRVEKHGDTNSISWFHVCVCLELPLSMIAFDEMFMTAVYVILFAGYSLVEEQYLSDHGQKLSS